MGEKCDRAVKEAFLIVMEQVSKVQGYAGDTPSLGKETALL